MAANTNPMTYNGYVAQIATLAVVVLDTSGPVYVGVDDGFNTLIPQMLNYAELRIQRDLDLLPSLTSGAYTLAAGKNLVSVPIDDFVTLQTISVQGAAPLLPVSKEFLQNMFSDPTFTGTPLYFAMIGGDQATAGTTSNNVLFGPYADVDYPLSVAGTVRLPSLYLYSNASQAGSVLTFISTYLPDLLIQASMIYISQFQRNFGPASNDPQMGPTYEAQYQTLLKNAITEEARKKFNASAWTAMSQPVVATPTR